MIDALTMDPRTRLPRVHIDDIRFTSDLHATTHYSLFIDGQQVDPSGPGQSVLQADTWEISAVQLLLCLPLRHRLGRPGRPPAVALTC